MEWKKFDADKADPGFKKVIEREMLFTIIKDRIYAIEKSNRKEYVKQKNKEYKLGLDQSLNKTIAVHVFCPEEFSDISSNVGFISILAFILFSKS